METAPVEAIRRFNRFYTKRIGVLNERLLESPLSLTEARVLFELARQAGCVASTLSAELAIDAGYLSRILRRFERDGLVRREPSRQDGRRRVVTLTPRGRTTFRDLDSRSHALVASMLQGLSPHDRGRVVRAMRVLQSILDAPTDTLRSCLLRTHQPGDLGWIVHRHGALYWEEYRWDERFEALVARVLSDFVDGFDPRRERSWIAEMNHEIAGSVFLCKQSDSVAKLRLLLVEPWARGSGLGTRLVDECIRFARRAGYEEITLWTNSELVAARRIYERAGFRRTAQEAHRSFGRDLVGETWELKL